MPNSKYKKLLQVIVLLLAVAFAVYRFGFGGHRDGGGNGDGVGESDCNWTERVPVEELVYVSHARCRMACRDIDAQLVEQVYLHGEVNCKKSSVKDGKHRYALEQDDNQGDRIRIIVEDDDGKHVIVTVIRLDRDDKCTCS
jgi:Domain of unknown function (DUF4258)